MVPGPGSVVGLSLKCHRVEIHCIKGQFLSYEGSASRCFKQKQALFERSANTCISPFYSKAALDTPEGFSETAVNSKD